MLLAPPPQATFRGEDDDFDFCCHDWDDDENCICWKACDVEAAAEKRTVKAKAIFMVTVVIASDLWMERKQK